MADDSQLFGAPAYEVLPGAAGWEARHLPVVLTCEHASDMLPPEYSWGDDEWLQSMHWAVDLEVG
jgi:predicted N-formylglutamate amidohydrolase